MLLVARSGSAVFCFEKATTVARLSFRIHGAGCDFTCGGGLGRPKDGEVAESKLTDGRDALRFKRIN